MAISEAKIKIVIDNYFKKECDVNTSIREAFEKGFRIGVLKGMETQSKSTNDSVPLDVLCEWLAERYEPPYALVDIDKLKMPIDFRQQKEIWMNVLTKRMEEQNA